MTDFIRGIHYFLTGFSLIFKPGMKRFIIMPLLINILLFCGLFMAGKHAVMAFNAWFIQHVPHWLQWLSTLVWLFFILSFFILMISVFVTLANMIAAPFNSLLAEKTEKLLSLKAPEPRSLMFNLMDTPRMIGRQFGIIFYYVPRAILLLLLFFIPIVHLAAPFLWFLFNAWFLTLTYLDYPCDNHHIPLRDMRAMLASRRWLMLGFGVSALITSMIPVLNLVAIPAAVAGATSLFFAQYQTGKAGRIA